MADAEAPNQPLIGAPDHAAVEVGVPQPRPSRAFKVAGITFLACVLIVGQAATAYFLLSQKSDIKSLKEQNNKISSELSNGRSAAIPARMAMNAMPAMAFAPMEKDTSAKVSPKPDVPLTTCQQEAAGLKPVQVPGFRPSCDSQGLYTARQCFSSECWCVDPASGEQVPGSVGAPSCATSASAGRLMPMALPGMDVIE